MPRGRFLSKSISLDEKVNALSDDTARLLFTWLIAHLDCEGRLHGDAMTVKSIVFPRRKISERRIDKYLNEISKLGLLFRYAVNGNTYLMAPQFEKHQMGLVKNKEAQSQIPPFTPDLLQSKAKLTPPQVQAKDKVKVEEEKSIEKKKHGEFSNVLLTDQEYEKLLKRFGASETKDRIERLSSGIASKGYRYQSHYATILNWKRRDDKEQAGGKNRRHNTARGLPKTYRSPDELYVGHDA